MKPQESGVMMERPAAIVTAITKGVGESPNLSAISIENGSIIITVVVFARRLLIRTVIMTNTASKTIAGVFSGNILQRRDDIF